MFVECYYNIVSAASVLLSYSNGYRKKKILYQNSLPSSIEVVGGCMVIFVMKKPVGKEIKNVRENPLVMPWNIYKKNLKCSVLNLI